MSSSNTLNTTTCIYSEPRPGTSSEVQSSNYDEENQKKHSHLDISPDADIDIEDVNEQVRYSCYFVLSQ